MFLNQYKDKSTCYIMPIYTVDNTIFTVTYNDEQITIEARYGADVYRAAIDGQSKQSFDIVCDLFDKKDVTVLGYSYIMLLKLPYMENHIGLELIQ